MAGAVWLGLLALVLNALVPVHLAFDLAEALEAARPQSAYAEAHSAAWRLLVRLTDHCEADDKSHKHGADHSSVCPVCSALGTLAGLALAAPAALATPAPIASAAAPSASEGEPPAAPPAVYRSRAPPVI
ncbi:MAG TPA: DUF2946 family protein [Stellaceae bacterium]|nr:DUF2946 family protein [Stellaceae bacterium]